ncbi:MAG: hypothetical protein ACLQVN_14345 [Bryobacteraceae bacterium]
MNISLFARRTTLAALAVAVLAASDTRTWSESEYSDFEKGNIKNLSLRSDGRLTVSPRSRELFDTNLPYLWSLARDSQGNLYAGGAGGKLYRVSPGSNGAKGKLLAEFDGLAVEAIAIDAAGRVYAATSPDGKVYRIPGNAKPEVFYDPKTKYIWAMVFDGRGNLYVATGDSGQIHRVTPDGKGTVWYSSGEAHVRSLAVDRAGNILAGTDPGGLVIRISPAGQGFVLYQMAKPEVTALAVAADGAIYAAGVGTKLATAPPAKLIQPLIAAPSATAPGNALGAAPGAVHVSPLPPASLSPAAGVSGGSEVYRIDGDGSPTRLWSNAQDVVYAIAFDGAGRPVLGTGNHGRLYRIDTPYLYTSLVSFPATQITALASSPRGELFAVTGNVGKVEQIGPELEAEGAIESDVFDAGMFTLWGRLSFDGAFHGGHISLAARSGNLDQPERDWSPWSGPIDDSKGARLATPPARFVQWKATLSGPAELQSVDLAYLPKNQAPRLEEIEITPPNYKFSPSSGTSSSTTTNTLTLPPLSRHPAPASPSFVLESSSTSTPSLQAAKGFIGARWLASDPNDDPLIYKVEIRGVNETEWLPLKDKITDKYLSWDSTAFPDGEYRLRVTASDAPGNPPSEALTASLESDRFLIDNTPPRIANLAVTRASAGLEVRWHAADALNNVTQAEYSLDGGDWTLAPPVTKLSDSMELDYVLTLAAGPGEHTIAVRVTDDYDNQAVEKVVAR